MATAIESGPGVATTFADVGVALGVNRRTIGDWAKLQGFPRNQDGTFSIAAVAIWNERRGQANGGDLKEEKLKAEIAKLHAETEAKQLRNSVLSGELYVARETDLYLNESAALVKTRLEQLPDEVAAEVPPDSKSSVREVTVKVVHRLLLELSGRQFTPTPEVDDDG